MRRRLDTRRFLAGDIMLKVLGLLPWTAAALKDRELLTVPPANSGLGARRPFLLFQQGSKGPRGCGCYPGFSSPWRGWSSG